MSDARRILEFAGKELDAFLATLKSAVEMESPTYGDKAASDRCGKFFQQLYQDLGFTVKVDPQAGCGDHFVAEYGTGSEAIMLAGHYDTVFPVGTLADMPWKVADGKVYGPGANDMKAGLVQIHYAIKTLQALGISFNKKILICVNGDEESGSPTSRALMEEVAKKSAYAFVLEPGEKDPGHVKGGRYGRAVYTITAHGRGAHSGNCPQEAVSPILELAHQIGVLDAMNDFEKVVTVSPTWLSSGIKGTAMIPGTGSLALDVRASTSEGLKDITAAIENLRPKLSGMRLEINGGMEKPVFERDEKNKALFAKADALAREFAYPLTLCTAGGGSDGNFISHAGTPTLDGMGPAGDCLHTPKEYTVLADIPFKVALLARLIQTL